MSPALRHVVLVPTGFKSIPFVYFLIRHGLVGFGFSLGLISRLLRVGCTDLSK